MMNDAVALVSFGVGYVAVGLMVLGAISAGAFKPQMKMVPVKVRSNRRPE